MKFLKQHKTLLIVLILAAILRLWQIGVVPASPDWDEAALGYNAYSILETGRDEYGKYLPVVLRSFDDYKPALYVYLIIPFIQVFDVSVVAVRMPSVIAGIAAVLLTYLLVKELLDANTKHEASHNKQLSNSEVTNSLKIALLASLLLAVSPWHLQFSRVAFEANLALTFNIALVYFFLRGLHKGIYLSIAAVCAGLSIYAYQSEKLFIPILLMLLVVCYKRELLKIQKQKLITAVLVLFIVVAPMAHFIVTDVNALKRAQATSIFTNNQELLKPSVERLIAAKKSNDMVGILINNRRVVYTQTMITNYFSHFNPQWLFITGDSPRHHAPGMGLLYLWELPFLLIGLGAILMKKQSFLQKNNKFFLLGWLILTPLPAIITNDVPHAVRTLNFLPTFQIITAIGLIQAYLFISRWKIVRKVMYVCIAVCIAINIGYFLYHYFVRTNLEYATEWQYGYKDAVTYVHQHENTYKNIVVSNQVPLDQSYIFFLFYLKYPPQRYQHEVAQYINKPIRGFDKYVFRPVDIQNIDFAGKETLYMVSSKKTDVTNPVHTVTNPDGTPAIYLIEGK